MYATPQDMIDRYGSPKLEQLTDIGATLTGAVVAVVLDRALQDASDEIDSYLAGRMAVPLENPPAVLTRHCCTIALYRLLGAGAGELERKDYETVIAFLTKVAEGRIALTPPADAPAVAGIGPVLFDPGTKAWGREQ